MNLLNTVSGILTASVLLAALAGCSSTSSHFHSDGRKANVASCTGSSWVPCYEKAGALCQSAGYEPIEKLSSREVGFWGSSELKQVIFICRNNPQAPALVEGEASDK